MKRFGGSVEFEGTFLGVIRPDRLSGSNHGSVVGSPFSTREKIDIVMTWPEALRRSQSRVHLYPKRSATAAWAALKPDTRIRFRASVTGITEFLLQLTGTELRGLSIVLEDAEPIG